MPSSVWVTYDPYGGKTMSDAPAPTPEAVGQFYDQMGQFFTILWGNNIHYGYWLGPDDTSSEAEAQERLTDLMIEKVALQPGQRLLDVGCGAGRPAVRLAQATGGQVLGVTVSPVQIGLATELAEREGVSDRVAFQYGNAMELPFPDESFDAAWAFESIVHMPDREQVLREIARVLRPGGRLALTDMTETAPIPDEFLALFMPSFQLNSLAHMDRYPELAAAVGLEVVEVRDLTPYTSQTLDRLSDSLAQKGTEISAVYGPELLAMMQGLLPQLAEIGRNHMGYMLFVARKPDSL